MLKSLFNAPVCSTNCSAVRCPSSFVSAATRSDSLKCSLHFSSYHFELCTACCCCGYSELNVELNVLLYWCSETHFWLWFWLWFWSWLSSDDLELTGAWRCWLYLIPAKNEANSKSTDLQPAILFSRFNSHEFNEKILVWLLAVLLNSTKTGAIQFKLEVPFDVTVKRYFVWFATVQLQAEYLSNRYWRVRRCSPFGYVLSSKKCRQCSPFECSWYQKYEKIRTV